MNNKLSMQKMRASRVRLSTLLLLFTEKDKNTYRQSKHDECG